MDAVAKVGSPLVDIRMVGGADDTPTPNQDSTPTAPSPKGQMDVAMPTTSKVLATPAVRRIAAENNVSGKLELHVQRILVNPPPLYPPNLLTRHSFPIPI